MKRCILWMLMLQIGAELYAQQPTGAALLLLDTTVNLELSPLGFSAFAGSNHADARIQDLRNPTDFLRNDMLGTKAFTSGIAYYKIPLAGFHYSVNSKSTVGMQVSTEGRATAWDVDGRLMAEIQETDMQKYNKQYPYNLYSGNNMLGTIASYNRWSFSFGRQLWSSKRHFFSTEVQLHLQQPISMAGIGAYFDSGTVKGNQQEGWGYLTKATGSISTYTSGTLYNRLNLGNALRTNGKLTPALDVRMHYTFKADSLSTLPYRLHLNVAMLDIGRLHYRLDAAFSRNYIIDISDGEALYFNQSMNGVTFNQTTRVFNRFPALFSANGQNSGDYYLNLPTRLFFSAHYNHTSQWHLGVLGEWPLQQVRSLNALNTYAFTQLIPGFTFRKLTVQLPVTYRQYTGVNVGMALQWRALYMHWENAFSSIWKSSRMMAGGVGLRWQLKAKPTVQPLNTEPVNDWGTYSHANTQLTYKEKSTERMPDALTVIDTLVQDTVASIQVQNWKQLLNANIATQAFFTSKEHVPFWLRSNRNGDIPLNGLSASWYASAYKSFTEDKQHRLLDWAMGADFRLYTGHSVRWQPIELWVAGRLGIFQARAGRYKSPIGVADRDLSSGNFSVSGNALGIPQVELGIPVFWYLPLTQNIIAVKGSMSYGWFGQVEATYRNTQSMPAYYHQKEIAVRIGKPNWRVNLQGSMNHQAMWGSGQNIYGTPFELNQWQTFERVFWGKAYGNRYVPNSKVGNQLGSIDQVLEAKLNHLVLRGYHQFFFDIGGLYHLTNIKDGIWGLSLERRHSSISNSLFWKKFLVEFIYSVSQGGEPHSKPTPSGAEHYYNNWIYRQGWTYQGENIGNPLFTQSKYIRSDLPQFSTLDFQNNRIAGLHVGVLWGWRQWSAKCFFTYTANYGTYNTAPVSKSTGGRLVYNNPPYFQRVNQLSALMEAERPIGKNGFYAGFNLAIDQGQLLYNSAGGSLRLTKRF